MVRLFFYALVFLIAPLISEEPPASHSKEAPAPVHLMDAQPQAPEVVPEVVMGGYESAFLKMFLTLIALIVAIFFTIWALKRLSQGRLHSLNGNRTIKIIERRALSPKTVLYLVEVAGKQAMIAESQLEVKRILTFENFNQPLDRSDLQ